jgi:methionyl-tRNA synthetase
MRDMTLGRDADFNEDVLRNRYQGDLANDLGNLLHRLVNMVGRYCEGRIPEPGDATPEDTALREGCVALVDEALELVEGLALNEALARVMGVVGEVNRYVEHAAPWKQSKEGRTERVATTLYTACEALRLTSVVLQPVMPERMAELWRRLGWQSMEPLGDGLAWGLLQPGTQVVAGPPLFPRDVGE